MEGKSILIVGGSEHGKTAIVAAYIKARGFENVTVISANDISHKEILNNLGAPEPIPFTRLQLPELHTQDITPLLTDPPNYINGKRKLPKRKK